MSRTSKLNSVEETIDVPGAIDDVFEAITDPERAHRWNPNVLGVDNISSGPIQIGKTWDQRTSIMGKAVTLTCRVSRFEPPRLGILDISGAQRARLTTWCESTALGTRVRQRIEFEPPGGLLGRIGGKVAAPLVHKELRQALERIRHAFESEREAKSGPRTP